MTIKKIVVRLPPTISLAASTALDWCYLTLTLIASANRLMLQERDENVFSCKRSVVKGTIVYSSRKAFSYHAL